jgi:hypothetical protein
MALEISSVASADRLRVQRDQATERALAQQREEAVARNRQAERFTEDRQRADAAARDLTQSRFQRDFVRSIDDDQRFDASRELAVKDARLDERVARDVADQRQLYADERVDAADQRFADQSAQPLTPTAAVTQPIAPLPLAAQDDNGFEQLLAERNTRLAERANAEQQFDSIQAQEFRQSQRSIDDLKADPSTLPEQPPRGGIVDFQA